MNEKTKVSFYTLGCRLNQAESAALSNRFRSLGFEVVDSSKPADIVVINTCTVTEHGDADTRRLVQRLRRRWPSVRIALIGCQSQVQGQKLLQMPGVQWVVGNAVKMDLPAILKEHADDDTPVMIVPEIEADSFSIPATAIDLEHTRANLKIQDGCNFFCSFCEIPYARGRARSREFDDLMREARELAAAGYREIILTGINIGAYHYQGKSLKDVLHSLAGIQGIERIRISSIEMTTIDEDIFQLMQDGKVCRFLHVPLQSGSDRILQAMNRRYRAQDFVQFIQRAHTLLPEICLGTDVMVGFPGESDTDFQLTYTLLAALPLTYFHVFSYSDRPHSKSRLLQDKLPQTVKHQRSLMLRQLSMEKRHAYFNKFIGSVQKVLFETEKDGFWSGLTDNYIRVRVPSAENLSNQFRLVRLQGIEGMSMTGILA